MDTFRSVEVVGMTKFKMEDLQRSSKPRNCFAVTMLKKKIVAEFLGQFSRRDPGKRMFNMLQQYGNKDFCQIFYFE